MKAGRFYRWAIARRKLAWCQDRLSEGRTVYLCNHLRITKIRRVESLKATKSGFYVQSGKNWVCADYCELRAE